jgi:hypothetical protein
MPGRRPLTAFALVLAGCASTGPAPIAPAGQPLPAARPTVRLMVDPASDSAFQSRVAKLMSSTGLDASLVLDGDPQARVDYTVRLKFEVREVPLTEFEQIWGMTDMFMLTMYPATCNRYRFSLDASVEDSLGAQIRTYSMQDVDTAWVWLLVGPKCGSPEGFSGSGVGDNAEQMLESLYRRIQRDGVLDPSRAAGQAASSGPLVYVTTNRAAELIEQGFRLDEAPFRFTFDPAAAGNADYTLKLDLAFRGGEYSGGRAYLALLTLGLSGFCSTTTATLDGSAFDRQGRLLNHFREVAHWQGPIESNCALYDETQKPEVVREMARDLRAQLTLEALTAFTGPGGATDVRPVVRISTNSCRPAVELVTNKRRPFAHVTLDESATNPPAYVLDLAFRSTGGGVIFDPGDSMAKQIALGALVGFTLGASTVMCKPTTHVLSAQLTDAAGRPVASYETSRSARSRGMGCTDDIAERPDVAAALVEDLYRQVARDPKLPPDLRAIAR